ncbi:Cof-type HAD-IIB family hydrolase [Bacillus sp. RG28]|uniref:Cof-type HAD-IIB family hydrolase n=1 Tax=Gottfriedia endophytica TaxID=2820819 RepID=A0A940SJZ9_9BACI|nr:Cof-type HAD-IIB family hydrolase [Gottfriedia endophytica]MBP0724743.1 Cof-type HAD-IIB family hydrolase [Gottfriedia endophytica]
MSKPIVFFDIDGTILNHQKEIPDSTKKAIQELQKKDVHVAIATGRAPFMFKDIREELNIKNFISLNGQYVEYEGQAIHKNPLDSKHLSDFVKKAETLNLPLIFLNEQTMKASSEKHPYITEAMNSLKMEHPEVDSEFYKDRDIYQALLFCEDGKEHEMIGGFDQFYYIRWHDLSMDVLPTGGSKATGIIEFAKHLGTNIEDVYAFGDGLNDLEMIQAVGTGIAMGNAVEPLKSIANHITTSCEEDGILNGLKWAGLI